MSGRVRVMRRHFIHGVAGLALAGAGWPTAASAQPDRAAFQALAKAIWAWKVAPSDLARIRAFVRTERIDTVLLSVAGPLADQLRGGNPGLLQELKGFRRDGVSLYALTGDPSWCGSDRLPDSVRTLIDVMKSDDRLFAGLSLDVEPNASPDWHDPAGRQKLIDGTISFFQLVRDGLGRLKLDAAVNPSFAGLKTSKEENFLAALTRRTDSVELMAYRNSPERTLHWAEKAIGVIAGTSRNWRLGVLVHSSRESGTSYFGRDGTSFLSDMVKLDRLARRRDRSRLYRGLAFEDYDGLRLMLS